MSRIAEMREKRRLHRRLETSPNTGVPYLERVLGIKFPKIPAAVEMTDRNKAVLARSGEIGTDVLSSMSHSHGHYSLKLGTYFFEENRDERSTDLHENLHGYLETVNTTVLGRNKLKHAERSRVLKCFAEGFADWGTMEALHRSDDPRERQYAIDHRDNYLYGTPLATGYVHAPDAPADSFDRLKEAVRADEAFNRLAKGGVIKFITGLVTFYTDIDKNFREMAEMTEHFRNGIRLMHHTDYVTGYHFMYGAMHVLVDNYGMETADAMNFLAHNPPLTIAQLENPADFVRKVKKASPPSRRRTASTLL